MKTVCFSSQSIGILLWELDKTLFLNWMNLSIQHYSKSKTFIKPLALVHRISEIDEIMSYVVTYGCAARELTGSTGLSSRDRA